MLFLPDCMAVRPALAGRLLFAFLLVSFLAATIHAKNALFLSLENADGDVLYSSPVKNGTVFGIRYLHSVALSPVTDYFVVRDNSIWLDRTVYEDFGAGLPHAPEGQQVMRHHNGKLSISGYNRKLDSFQLRVGRVANHVLLLMPGKEGRDWVEIPLDQIAEPGSAVTFAVRSNPQGSNGR